MTSPSIAETLVTGILMAFHTLLHLLDKAGQVISLRKGGDQ